MSSSYPHTPSAEVNEAGAVNEFLTAYNHQRAPNSLTEIYGPDLQPQASNERHRQIESDTESRVFDYGIMGRVESLRNRRESNIPEDLLLGLGSSAPREPMPSILEMEVELSVPRKEFAGTLRKALESAVVEYASDDTKNFLPLGQLDAKCHKVAVRRELCNTFGDDSPDIERYVDYIFGNPSDPKNVENSSRKLFAILVLIEQVSKIRDFADGGIMDRHLPFRKEPSPGGFSLVRRATWKRSESVTMSCFDDWEPVPKRHFWERQWSLLAPYIAKAQDRSVALYELDPQAIMPWTGMDETKAEESSAHDQVGGYSTVSRVAIHPDHHDFAHECNWFAIKTLNSPDEIAFKKEFNNLKRFETREHLLQLYAAFKRGKKYSFLFPWADGGSLRELWAKDPRLLALKTEREDTEVDESDRNRSALLWVAHQLVGLTGETGLAGLHETKRLGPSQPGLTVSNSPEEYGIHGDIKPENILHFEQLAGLGVLKISDFGLTAFHSVHSRSRLPPTGPMSPTYRAPEYEVKTQYLSRKYDIWSLGCVLSEFMTWFILGTAAIDHFVKQRLQEEDEGVTKGKWKEDRFFKIINGTENQRSTVSKASVESWLDELSDAVNGDNFLYDCIQFIKHRMLEVDSQKRADCREVHTFLSGCLDRCDRDMRYTDIKLPPVEPHVETNLPMDPEVEENHSMNLASPPSIQVTSFETADFHKERKAPGADLNTSLQNTSRNSSGVIGGRRADFDSITERECS
ncbi:Uu.00g039980.m01.CDS01 [Anthostomella pinea]|uniref:Uu.00g039980.m01.CDS01 n=1 Tax=Anthostomella pinea TaxID=933095 RepID=A0AAI8VB30_9PEZI|nr:Uu.00g039980.m01.CDS01 [Anthostomella pinea]